MKDPAFDLKFTLAELQSHDNFMLVKLLKDLGDYPITKIMDKSGLTLLHHAVLSGIEQKTQLLIDFGRNFQQLPEDELLNWINKKTTDEGWTALHYGSFSGNIDSIYTLIENKADINVKNANGLNMMHVAAQGDSAPPLYHFRMLGVDQNSTDSRGSTPLHWACYSQSETALAYLLAWNP